MKTNELIAIARKCGERTSRCEDCRLHTASDCTVQLLNELADKLEKAMADIECSKCCYNCINSGKSFKEPPCSICEILDFNKWEWKGDAE